MKQLLIAFFAILTLCSTSAAESSDTQMQTILDALKSIEARLTALEQKQNASTSRAETPDADRASTPSSAAKPRSPAASAASTVPPPSGMQAKPGWLIGLLPDAFSDYQQPALAFFEAPNSGFNLLSHRQEIATKDNFAYKAQAKLNAYESGIYTIGARMESDDYSTFCELYIKIDDKTVYEYPKGIVEGKDGYIMGTAYIKGPASHNIEMDMNCDDKASVKRITPIIRPPSVMSPRQFLDTELFHYVKGTQASPPTTARSTSAASASTSATLESFGLKYGDSRLLVSDVSVRHDPTTGSDVMGKIGTGNVVDIDEVSEDGAWIKIYYSYGDSQGTGFISISDLVANSRSAR